MKLKKVEFNLPYRGDLDVEYKVTDGYSFKYNDRVYIVHKSYTDDTIWSVSDGESGLLIYENGDRTRKACITNSKNRIDQVTEELRNRAKTKLGDNYNKGGIILDR